MPGRQSGPENLLGSLVFGSTDFSALLKEEDGSTTAANTTLSSATGGSAARTRNTASFVESNSGFDGVLSNNANDFPRPGITFQDEECLTRTVLSLRRAALRTATRIMSFYRVKAVVVPCFGRASPTELNVTVDPAQTIEHLQGLLEAEFAYTLSASSRSSAASEYLSHSGPLFTEEGVLLTPSSSIQAALRNGATVVLILSYFLPIRKLLEIETKNLSKIEVGLKLVNKNSQMHSVVSESQMLYAIMLNYSALSLFREICTSCYQLHHLLFWLELEVLLNLTNSGVQRRFMAYVEKMYLSSNAPLYVSVPQELLKQEIRNEGGENELLQIRATEIQDYVFCSLRSVAFQKFRKTQLFDQILKLQKSSSVIYAAHGIAKCFGDYFKENRDLMLEIEKEINYLPNFSHQYAVDKYLNRVLNIYFPKAAPILGYPITPQEALQKSSMHIAAKADDMTNSSVEERWFISEDKRKKRQAKLRSFFGVSAQSSSSSASSATASPNSNNESVGTGTGLGANSLVPPLSAVIAPSSPNSPIAGFSAGPSIQSPTANGSNLATGITLTSTAGAGVSNSGGVSGGNQYASAVVAHDKIGSMGGNLNDSLSAFDYETKITTKAYCKLKQNVTNSEFGDFEITEGFLNVRHRENFFADLFASKQKNGSPSAESPTSPTAATTLSTHLLSESVSKILLEKSGNSNNNEQTGGGALNSTRFKSESNILFNEDEVDQNALRMKREKKLGRILGNNVQGTPMIRMKSATNDLNDKNDENCGYLNTANVSSSHQSHGQSGGQGTYSQMEENHALAEKLMSVFSVPLRSLFFTPSQRRIIGIKHQMIVLTELTRKCSGLDSILRFVIQVGPEFRNFAANFASEEAVAAFSSIAAVSGISVLPNAQQLRNPNATATEPISPTVAALAPANFALNAKLSSECASSKDEKDQKGKKLVQLGGNEAQNDELEANTRPARRIDQGSLQAANSGSITAELLFLSKRVKGLEDSLHPYRLVDKYVLRDIEDQIQEENVQTGTSDSELETGGNMSGGGSAGSDRNGEKSRKLLNVAAGAGPSLDAGAGSAAIGEAKRLKSELQAIRDQITECIRHIAESSAR